MRVMVLFCHPVETSFHASLHAEVVATLRSSGHQVDDCDLYAEGFNPVMSREERLGYHEEPSNIEPVRGYVERLRRAEALLADANRMLRRRPAPVKRVFERIDVPRFERFRCRN